MGKGRRISMSTPSSLASSRSDVSRDEKGDRQTARGPYMEGNMHLLATIECPNDIMCCRFNENGSLLAVGLIDGSIKIYEIFPLTCNHLYTLQDDETVKGRLPVTQIKFKQADPEDPTKNPNILVASYASGLVKFWHYTSSNTGSNCLHTINEPDQNQILTLAINPESTHFALTGDDPRIFMYDLNTLQKTATLEPSDSRDVQDGHKCRVFALQYHPTIPHVFLSGGWDNTVQYWDDRLIHAQRHISGPHICGDAIDIDPRYNHILTGSWRMDSALQIWDFMSAKKIKDIPPEPLNNSQVYCCQWLGEDSIICGGHNHNMARIIDRGTLNTTGQLLDLSQSVYCIDNDKHGKHPKIAIGSNRYIYIVKEEKKS